MNYQICYFSPQGHARELADAFKTRFPSRTAIIDLRKEQSFDADICLIGFELVKGEVDEIPETVCKTLTKLDSSEVIAFATCPVTITEKEHRRLEMRIKSMLPQKCRFCGMFVCRGEVYDTMTKELGYMRQRFPYDESIAYLYDQYRKSKGHPNRNDVRNGLRFIAEALGV